MSERVHDGDVGSPLLVCCVMKHSVFAFERRQVREQPSASYLIVALHACCCFNPPPPIVFPNENRVHFRGFNIPLLLLLLLRPIV